MDVISHGAYTLCNIDGNASKPAISKMHNVQETQKTVSLLNK